MGTRESGDWDLWLARGVGVGDNPRARDLGVRASALGAVTGVPVTGGAGSRPLDSQRRTVRCKRRRV